MGRRSWLERVWKCRGVGWKVPRSICSKSRWRSFSTRVVCSEGGLWGSCHLFLQKAAIAAGHSCLSLIKHGSPIALTDCIWLGCRKAIGFLRLSSSAASSFALRWALKAIRCCRRALPSPRAAWKDSSAFVASRSLRWSARSAKGMVFPLGLVGGGGWLPAWCSIALWNCSKSASGGRLATAALSRK